MDLEVTGPLQHIELRDVTGVVIPTWVPPDTSVESCAAMLRMTLSNSKTIVRPEHCAIVVDGCPVAFEALKSLATCVDLPGGLVHVIEQNRGKAGAVAAGLSLLMKNESIQYFVVRDHDNDHLIEDLPGLVKLADQMVCLTKRPHVVAIGGRASVQRHLGFARGELEWFGNEVVLAAVQWRLAREGGALDTRFWSAYGLVPDMQSGYKVYSRDAALAFVERLAGAVSRFPDCALEATGSELIPLVETWLRGGIAGQLQRRAWESQPMTTFVSEQAVALKVGVLSWCLLRCEAPPSVARVMLENAGARRDWIKDATGAQALLAIINGTLRRLAEAWNETWEPVTHIVVPERF